MDLLNVNICRMEQEMAVVEASLCEKCGRLHVGNDCSSTLVSFLLSRIYCICICIVFVVFFNCCRLEDENFVLEFAQLSHDEHIEKLRKNIQQLRDEKWTEVARAQNYKFVAQQSITA